MATLPHRSRCGQSSVERELAASAVRLSATVTRFRSDHSPGASTGKSVVTMAKTPSESRAGTERVIIQILRHPVAGRTSKSAGPGPGRQKRSKEYWVVMSGPIPGGNTLFAVRWSSAAKGGLPTTMDEAQAGEWTATAFNVRSLSRESLVPRGGSLDLRGKSVLLVGCGSVGSELACGLASAGIGKLELADPDTLSAENLYRHRLTLWDVGVPKSQALARYLGLGYPRIEVRHCGHCLQDLRDKDLLRHFDLVVVAIGSPTVERAFAEFCIQAQVDVPTIHCWLEGYGIGGHAILAVPGSKGCWHCAYVDPASGERGLSSSLNFLAPNQVVMRDLDGCGAQFLPFSSLAAARTAWMAADLAVRFLGGEAPASTRVSWHGSARDAADASLETTPRYQGFTESLRLLPLHDPRCDVCER